MSQNTKSKFSLPNPPTFKFSMASKKIDRRTKGADKQEVTAVQNKDPQGTPPSQMDARLHPNALFRPREIPTSKSTKAVSWNAINYGTYTKQRGMSRSMPDGLFSGTLEKDGTDPTQVETDYNDPVDHIKAKLDSRLSKSLSTLDEKFDQQDLEIKSISSSDKSSGKKSKSKGKTPDPTSHMNPHISKRMQMILDLKNDKTSHSDHSSNSSGKSKKSGCKRKTAPPKPPRRDMVFVVNLACRNRQLGLSIGQSQHDVTLWGGVVKGRGRMYQRSGDGRYLMIEEVLPDSRSAVDGRLKEGDELFEINGVSLEDTNLEKGR